MNALLLRALSRDPGGTEVQESAFALSEAVILANIGTHTPTSTRIRLSGWIGWKPSIRYRAVSLGSSMARMKASFVSGWLVLMNRKHSWNSGTIADPPRWRASMAR